MTRATDPIGIIDSGMGGITVWAELARTLPGESTHYWADTAHCPYGGRSREEICALVGDGVRELLARGVKLIVLACNTATTVAIRQLRTDYPGFPFIGLEPAVKPAARDTESGVIGVLATAATLESDMFRQTCDRYARHIRVIATPGEGLVELAEQERENTPEAEALLRNLLHPMTETGADQLVLACTHYPFFTPLIRRIVGKRMQIINPAPAIVRHTREVLEELGLNAPADHTATHDFLSSAGPAEAERLSRRAYAYLQTLQRT